jgi:hypothetical protein
MLAQLLRSKSGREKRRATAILTEECHHDHLASAPLPIARHRILPSMGATCAGAEAPAKENDRIMGSYDTRAKSRRFSLSWPRMSWRPELT